MKTLKQIPLFFLNRMSKILCQLIKLHFRELPWTLGMWIGRTFNDMVLGLFLILNERQSFVLYYLY